MKKYLLFILPIFFISFVSALTPVPSLYLHQVLNTSEMGYFNVIMKSLYDNGFTSITMEEFGMMQKGVMNVPSKPFIITFDDDYVNVITNALPIMEKYGFRGVMAYNTGYPGWHSPRLNYSDLVYLHSKGWQIASHSVGHVNLFTRNLSMSRIIYEMNKSRIDIYKNTGIMPTYFVFPENGASNELIKLCLTMYDYCSAPVNRSAWTISYLEEDKFNGIPRIYVEEQKRVNTYEPYIKAFKKVMNITTTTTVNPVVPKPNCDYEVFSNSTTVTVKVKTVGCNVIVVR